MLHGIEDDRTRIVRDHGFAPENKAFFYHVSLFYLLYIYNCGLVISVSFII